MRVVAPPRKGLLVAFLLACAAVCGGGARVGTRLAELYEPQNIFYGADNDPAVGIGSFVPGDAYGLGPFRPPAGDSSGGALPATGGGAAVSPGGYLPGPGGVAAGGAAAEEIDAVI
ncbi:unnamed protein product [Spirodela intermedia]|uniref:Uncharacterized protein n=1 Tax=Spirodela intermedia TaxID=51605 RepID=A0A7I8IYE1_SPIIN|nr:unnamed protein product [Spirodela intermedia]CAA6662163.1 unnamed protein product [Spirodela intermedia]